MNTFRVLRISNNLEEYPDCTEDTLEFPDMVEYLDDEMDIFVYCNETGEFWHSDEFFSMVGMTTFSSENAEFI